MRPPCEQHGHVIYGRAQVEVYVLQTRGSSLYLGEVQDVVEDHHQVLIRAPHGLGVLALVLIEGGVQQEIGQAYTAVHGGSISWLMLARNSLLARLASSALSLAF